ncbi:MAG: amino acid adenylation domain-containing protein [Cyanobacteria bacterium P01_C01_bin.72]
MQSNIVDIQTEKIQGFRLSPQQKRIWLLQTQVRNNPYQVKCCLTIEGALDINRLQQAWHKIVERHEILRTEFKHLSGMTIPLQVITESSPLASSKLDLAPILVNQQHNYLDDFWQSQEHQISLKLADTGEQQHILLINLPALYGDVSSLPTLVSEISNYYQNLDFQPALEAEPMQYADFAEWQNELLEAENTEIGRKYWSEQKYTAVLDPALPQEKLTSDLAAFRPQVINSSIDSDCLRQITSLAQEAQTSTAAFLFTCWQILIYRLTRQPELVIAIADDGRKYEELQSTIGLITKYLPIQNHLDTDVSSKDLLSSNHDLLQAAAQKQEYFSHDEAASFAVAFEFIPNYQIGKIGDLTWKISQLYSCSDRFKLKLSVQQQDDSLALSFYYDAGLFEASDVQSLAEQFNTLVLSILKHPGDAISQLDILSESEQQKILVDFNQTKTDFSPQQTIPQRFEVQAAKTPQATALNCQGQQLTYQQLNQRANQLAHYLQSQGISTEDLVALYLEPSLETIVGLLGILKAGAAYVPLDSNLPPERLAWMLQDTQARVILTQQQLASNLPEFPAKIICLDTDWKIIQQENEHNLRSVAQLGNLAYVIYTSGSTGKPKGVGIEHQQISNYLNSILAKIAPGNDDDNWAMVSTFGADLGNTMLFPALCTGGCLHLISFADATDGEALGRYFQQHQIDYLKITPSHLAALLLVPQPELILPRQTLIVGGEVLNWSLVNKIKSLAPECDILNHYGPTETTVGVITYPVEVSSARSPAQTVPIGKPLANTQIFILDEQLQPLPLGIPGEIHIGGMQVSRGYLNQPELTQEKFITNPSAKLLLDADTENRLYKTGDLGKYLPDGNIEFLGRVDRQVKVRGFRIELGEIESALLQHPAVQQAVVIFQSDNQRLVSYLTAKSNFSPPNSAELRDFLAAQLPEHAIPSMFIALREFPLTANGKIDRQQLPAPEKISLELTAAFVAPQTDTEKAIAEIWSGILDVERVGIHDNFFELGGHSLLATQVVSHIRQALQTELSLRQFFDSPTVAGITTTITQNLAMEADQEELAAMLAELEQLPESTLAEEEEND